MAEIVSIGVGNPAKIRNPWAVAGLVFATGFIGFVIYLSILFSILLNGGETGVLVWITPFVLAPIFLPGIYAPFWLYFVLRELRDYGVARSDERLSKIRPTLNVVVMIVIGCFVVPAIVVLVLLIRRVRHAQELAGVDRSSLPLLIALLVGFVFFAGLFPFLVLAGICGVIQDGLNRVWSHLPPATPAVSPALIETAPPASSR